MYRHCIYCASDLGANREIEKFPVGRRLAFDPERGRLWVVCRSCERWNLTPLAERWEALEALERRYRDTRQRVSTENIGLARLPDGLDLVRVGRPRRPEFAAWRYGDQFGRRRRKFVITAVAGGGITLGLGLGSAAIAGLSTVLLPLHMVNIARLARARYTSNTRIHASDDRVFPLQDIEVGYQRIRMDSDYPGGWVAPWTRTGPPSRRSRTPRRGVEGGRNPRPDRRRPLPPRRRPHALPEPTGTIASLHPASLMPTLAPPSCTAPRRTAPGPISTAEHTPE